MKDAITILEEFGRLGTRCAFDLKGGLHYEGYVLETEGEHVVFGCGGPMAPEDPVLIPADAVDLGSLSFWDESRRCYMDARWDEGRGRWMAKPARQGGGWEPLPERPADEDDEAD